MLPRGSWFGVLAFIALLAGIISAPTAPAQQGPLPKALTPEDLASRTFYRRAVDAVIWGLPLVGEDAVIPSPRITMETEFKWDMPNYFGVDARAIALFQYFCPTAKLGTTVSTSAPFTTTTASRWRAGTTTACTFRRMFR